MAEKENAPTAIGDINKLFVRNNTTEKHKKPEQMRLDFGVPTLMTPRQFIAANPAFTMGGLRNYIFYEDINGLKASGAIQRIGRKILIDPTRFHAWVASNPQPTGGAL